MKAAMAALAANNQGKFRQFHRKLFEYCESLNDQKIEIIARELKLDMKKFFNDPTVPDITAVSYPNNRPPNVATRVIPITYF